MSDVEICEWCHTEIVWDPEFGKEEMCPHCLNMLRDYRKLEIPVEVREDQVIDENESDDDFVFEEAPQSKADFEQTLQSYGESQTGGADCGFCGEITVKIGKQMIPEKQFIPYLPDGLNKPLLKAPFDLDVFLCPSCKQVQFILPDKG